MVPRLSRRGALAAAALTVSGCGAAEHPRSRGPRPGSGVATLNSVLALEHAGVAAYGAAAALLRGPQRASVDTVREQEREHVRRLAELIDGLGGRAVGPHPAAQYARSFPRLSDARDALLLAEDLEERLVRAHLDALTKLPAGPLRRVAASIAASEAEHLAVVRGLRGVARAPDAFVTGTS